MYIKEFKYITYKSVIDEVECYLQPPGHYCCHCDHSGQVVDHLQWSVLLWLGSDQSGEERVPCVDVVNWIYQL